MPSLIRRAFDAITGIIWQRGGGSGWGRSTYILPGARYNYEREAGDLWTNPVVGLCLDWLGNRFPRPLIRVSRIAQKKGDGHKPGDYLPIYPPHPLAQLWCRPNPYYTRRAMEKAVGLSLKCDGNAYVYKVRAAKGGPPVQLWWLPHDRVFPSYPEDGSAYLDGYMVRIGNQDWHCPVEDLIHFRDGIDPLNDRLGLSALRACVREVCTINEESGYRAAILRNSAVPSLAVIPDGDALQPNQQDADAIRERLWETSGGENRGRAVIFGGNFRIEKIGYSPEEMNLVEFPTIPTARILSALGVAPMSLGLPDAGKTYSNLGEANRASWGTIIATQELMGETLRYQLLPEFGADPDQHVVEYDYGQIEELRDDQAALWTRVLMAWEKGAIMQNEAREMLGLDADPDGDRWFPGTGDPAEIERQQQEDLMYSGAMSRGRQSGADSPSANAPAADGGTNGRAKHWRY